MAQPIPLELSARDANAEVDARLHAAPTQHAAAILAGYQVLQALHDRGVLDFLAGALGSADKVLPMMADAAKSPEAVRGTRNLLALGKLLCSLEPELLQGIAHAVAGTLSGAKQQEPLTFWQLFQKLRNKDTRRALTAITCVLESLGKSLK